MNANSIRQRLAQVQERIQQACLRSGREPQTVRLMAVSKTKPAGAVLELVQAGQVLFGENRVQEARDKIPLVAHPQVEWHLIGTLQKNKVHLAVRLFNQIHSVDRLALAEEINRLAPGPEPFPILIQINIGREPQKQGFLPEQLPEVLAALAQLPKLAVRGFMAIPPEGVDPETARPYFQAMTRLAMPWTNTPWGPLTEISMGMSHDFEIAIEEGATLVRVGSAVFGSR